jgi:hypothetical protein
MGEKISYRKERKRRKGFKKFLSELGVFAPWREIIRNS